MSASVFEPQEIEQDRQRRAREMAADQGEGWAQGRRPGSVSCHELLDRAALLAGLVDRYLLSYPACVASPERYRLAEQAARALSELDQRVGAQHLSAEE